MSDMNGSSGTSVYRISPLHGTENFNTWRIQMEDILTDLGLYDYVIGMKPFPPYDVTQAAGPSTKGSDGKDVPGASIDVVSTTLNDEQKKWIKDDRKALSQIRLRVDAHSLTHIQSCTGAKSAWDLLISTFQVQGTVGLIDLRRKFFSHRMADGEDVEEHMRKTRDWFQQINVISPAAITEVDWITTLVASLPDSWDSFTQSVDFNFDFGDISILSNKIADLRSRILAEAHRRTTRDGSTKAFYTNNRPYNNSNRSFNSAPKQTPHGSDKSNTTCNNCGRLGHWAAECRRPGGGAYINGNNRPEYQQQGKPAYNRFKQPNESNDNPRAHYGASYSSRDSWSFSANDEDWVLIDRTNDFWVADSGTTTHIARDKSIFSNYRNITGTVHGVTGKNAILGRGSVTLRCKVGLNNTEYKNVILEDVAHVPTSPTNLISLSLATEQGLNVNMSANTLEILSPTGDTVTLGQKIKNQSKGNLWQVLCEPIEVPSHTSIQSKEGQIENEPNKPKPSNQGDTPSGVDNTKVLSPIAPPAEGEIVLDFSSISERLKESEGTGGDLQDIEPKHTVDLQTPTTHSPLAPIHSKSDTLSTPSTSLSVPSATRFSIACLSKSSTTSVGSRTPPDIEPSTPHPLALTRPAPFYETVKRQAYQAKTNTTKAIEHETVQLETISDYKQVERPADTDSIKKLWVYEPNRDNHGQNVGYKTQSKHIDIRHHFIRDCIEKRVLSPLYVNTKDNLADALTKPLPAIQFFKLVDQIMGQEDEDLAHAIEIEEID